MSFPKPPFESDEDFHHERLQSMRIGWNPEISVAAEMYYCAKLGIEAPPWLVKRAADLTALLLTGQHPKKRGRSCSPVARLRQDLIDYIRADAVREIREKQVELKEDVQELRSTRNVPAWRLKEQENFLAWVGRGWLRAYECAAMRLAKTPAACGPDAIKASYLRMKRSGRDRRLNLIDSGFLRLMGVAALDQPKGKHIPLYERTL